MTFPNDSVLEQELLDVALPNWLNTTYGERPERAITLLRAHTNMVFELWLPTGHVVVKVWGEDWRTDTEIDWELQMLRHLVQTGIDVSPARPGLDGFDLQQIDTSRGRRWAVMFPFAPGDKPKPPFQERDYWHEGAAVARLHTALDTFRPTGPDRRLGLEELVDEPLRFALTHCRSATTARHLRSAAIDVRERLIALHAELDHGPVHGDLTFDNVHIDGDRHIWYDFDSGGIGYRALDLQGWAAFDLVNHRRQSAFLDGYKGVRPISEAGIVAAPLLTVAQEIWSLAVDLRYRVIDRGADAVSVYLDERAMAIETMLNTISARRLAAG